MPRLRSCFPSILHRDNPKLSLGNTVLHVGHRFGIKSFCPVKEEMSIGSLAQDMHHRHTAVLPPLDNGVFKGGILAAQ